MVDPPDPQLWRDLMRVMRFAAPSPTEADAKLDDASKGALWDVELPPEAIAVKVDVFVVVFLPLGKAERTGVDLYQKSRTEERRTGWRRVEDVVMPGGLDLEQCSGWVGIAARDAGLI
jgi:hypothetical protein